MFKVVPDQLRISEGWVRCGKCSEVFDAARNLQVMAPLPRASTARPGQGTPAQDTKPAVMPAGGSAGESVGASTVSADPGPGPASRQEPAQKPAAAVERPEFGASTLDLMPDAARPELAGAVTASSLLARRERQAAPPPDDVDALNSVFFAEPSTVQSPDDRTPSAVAGAPDSVPDEDVSFVRDARRKAFWRSPVMRVFLAVVALALVGLLVAQVALHERNRLASLHPQLKPWLVQLCDVMRCEVEVPRQIESIVIDNSSFTRIRGDLFRLGFVVRNTSGVEVAAPAVELTLTDTQEKPVIRRVLQPAELGAGAVLAPRGEWSASLNLGVASGGDNVRVAGYRLLAFYP